MGIAAAIIGSIGGLSAVLGILTILEVELNIGDQFTWTFWFVLSAVLFLASIAISAGRGQNHD
jgi:hypothetical protein